MNGNTPEISNDHNVYVLGAGFGVGAGLPLTKQFMTRMRATVDSPHYSPMNAHADKIAKVLKFRLDSTAASYRVPLDVDNIEELFSLAVTRGGQEGLDLEDAMSWAIAVTIDFAYRTHRNDELDELKLIANRQGWTPPANWKKRKDSDSHTSESLHCPPYDFYAAVMGGYKDFYRAQGRRDTIITFNYDTLVEDSLHHLGTPFSYGFYNDHDDPLVDFDKFAQCVRDGTKAVEVLKLHGSVNWGIADPVKNNLRVFGTFVDLLQSGNKPILVPPTWRKGWGRGHPVTTVWDAAVSALGTATRIIILGYSIPQTDIHFKYLLAAGLQTNISLQKVLFVNPALDESNADDEERKRMTDNLFGKYGLFRPEHLNQDIIELVPIGTRDFFLGDRDASHGPHRIGRPLNPPGSSVADAAFRFTSYGAPLSPLW